MRPILGLLQTQLDVCMLALRYDEMNPACQIIGSPAPLLSRRTSCSYGAKKGLGCTQSHMHGHYLRPQPESPTAVAAAGSGLANIYGIMVDHESDTRCRPPRRHGGAVSESGERRLHSASPAVLLSWRHLAKFRSWQSALSAAPRLLHPRSAAQHIA